MKKGLVKLYRIARLLTSKEFTLIFAVAILALLFTGVSTFGHYEQKKHEEPIVYEEYHSGMAMDAPVQFCAVSARAALYTEKQNGNTTTYYAYIIMKDAKGNRLVTVMQKASSASTPNNDPQASLKLDVSSFVDEINGKGGTLYYGVISSNSLDQQTQSISLMPVSVNEYDKTRMELQSLQTLDIYTDSVPQSTTVVDKSEFVRDGGSWFLLAAAVLLLLYVVMWVLRFSLHKKGIAGNVNLEDIFAFNAEVHRQAEQRAQEDKQRKEKEQAAEKAAQPKPATVPTPASENVDAWRAEVHRQAQQRAQEDKQRKAAEKPAQKAEQPKPTTVPTPASENADAWRAEVHRQAEQRAQEDKQRKAAEQSAQKAEKPKSSPVDSSTQDDAQTPPDHSEWAAWAKDKSNHERLQKLCGVKLVGGEEQSVFAAYYYTLGPKGWDDIKRIMVTIINSDRGTSRGKIQFATYIESGCLGSNEASKKVSINEEKISEVDIKLEENSWMRLTVDGGSVSMRCPIRLLIYNQTGQAALQVSFTQKAPEEFTLYLCGVLAATFGIAGKAPSGDVEQGINAVIEYIDGQSEHTERTDCADSAQSADSEQKETVQPTSTDSPASVSNQTLTSEDETEPEAVRILRAKICQKLCNKSYREHGGGAGSYRLVLLQGEESWRYFHNWSYASFELSLKTGKLRVDLSDGANSFGYGREDHCAISAERFHEIAVECGMSPELQWFRTEEDWARLFDDQLQSVIDDTIASKRKKDAKEKEERRLSHGVELSAEYWTQTPGMWIESVRILLMQRHGSSSISLTKKNGTYYLHGQALSSAEAVWVERQVEAALGSRDNSIWSSFVGGDRISVTIRTSRWANVEIKYEAVPTKYYNLLSQLQKLQDYGSKDMRN